MSTSWSTVHRALRRSQRYQLSFSLGAGAAELLLSKSTVGGSLSCCSPNGPQKVHEVHEVHEVQHLSGDAPLEGSPSRCYCCTPCTSSFSALCRGSRGRHHFSIRPFAGSQVANLNKYRPIEYIQRKAPCPPAETDSRQWTRRCSSRTSGEQTLR